LLLDGLHRKVMKIRVIVPYAVLVLTLGGSSFSSVYAGGCYECPDGSMVESAKDCPDPAFLGIDRKPRESLAVRRVKETKLPVTDNLDNLNATELSIWKGLERDLQKDPKSAFSIALDIWSSNYSDGLQRMAIYRAKAYVRSTEETEKLNFMIRCLEDYQAQKEICLNLGKGNGLERKLGASGLALLNKNPKYAH
jgi:hypothetical protein